MITCHEVNPDDSLGPPIKGVYYRSAYPEAADYAEQAANLLDEAGWESGRFTQMHLDGSSRVIEVRGLAGDTGPRRFRVRCEVKRHYTAEPEGI